MKMLAPDTKDPTKDVCVRAGSGWKALLLTHRNGQSSTSGSSNGDSPTTSGSPVGRRQSHSSLNNESDPSQALIAQKEEILWLWRDPDVRKTLLKRGLQLEDTAGL
jgi:guanine nucleotide-binding protein subunit alpha